MPVINYSPSALSNQEKQLLIVMKKYRQEMFGDDISVEIERSFKCRYLPSDIFPLLKKLQGQGFIGSRPSEDARRNRYFLTESGKNQAAIAEEFWK